MTLLLAEMGFASAFGPSLATAIQAQLDQERCLARNIRFVGADFQEQVCAFQDNEDVDILGDALQRLIEQALLDLIERLGPDASPTPVDVILCLPETAPEDGMPSVRLNALGETLPPYIYQTLADTCIEANDMRLVTDAQSGPARVIQSIFRKGADRAFLFICADSYSDRDRLNALLGQKRLFADEIANYSLIPGEAAAAMLILPEAMRMGEPLAYIGAASSAPEPVGEMDNVDTLSQAISDSALAALDSLGAGRRPVDRFLTDFNNSRYRASEGAYCLHRLVEGYLAEDIAPLYPALDFGDCGAAYFGLAMAQLCAEATSVEQPLQALILSSTTWSKSRAAIVAQTNPIRLFGLHAPTVEEDDFFDDDEDPEDDTEDAPPPLEEVT
ncbi:MAG: hypothetical protein AAFN94_14120 [Pseudomonadota bacterium]